MRDITNINWKDQYTKIVEGDPAKMAKQKVFFLQNGIEYGAAGLACNKAQVKKYYSDVATEAQATADAALAAAKAAQENADNLLSNANPPAPPKKAAAKSTAKSAPKTAA